MEHSLMRKEGRSGANGKELHKKNESDREEPPVVCQRARKDPCRDECERRSHVEAFLGSSSKYSRNFWSVRFRSTKDDAIFLAV